METILYKCLLPGIACIADWAENKYWFLSALKTMKKQLIAIVALFLAGALAADDAFAGRWHRGGHRWHGPGRVGVGVVVGAPFFWRPWYYSPPYYPPVIIERRAPPVYVEQSPLIESRPQTRYAGYWYYCQSPSGYYPEVRECPRGWVKVPPRP
jgi:hypothetical protein